MVSPERHLTETVPFLAMNAQVLYYSCLALGAHIMCLQGMINRSVEEEFQDAAINLLIPLLSEDPRTWSPGTILTTTIILRTSEQLSEIGDDAKYHLTNAFSVFAATGEQWSTFRTDVDGVAFWTYLRQCIRVCFLQEQPVPFDIDIVEHEPNYNPAPDVVWTNRITLLLARLCNVCWSTIEPNFRADQLKEINTLLNEWIKALPPTFRALCCVKEGRGPFSFVRYLGTWHGE